MEAFNDGFMAAWDRGVEKLNAAFAGGEALDFVILNNAWAVYPPAPLPAQGGRAARPGEELIRRETDQVIGVYIGREIQPRIEALQRQIAASPTGSLYSQLGLLLIRSNRTREAKTVLEQGAGMGSVPAMINRGNLAVTERDYAAAALWFRRALAKDGENSAALRGLEFIEERAGLEQ
jgi:TPR repeat protein